MGGYKAVVLGILVDRNNEKLLKSLGIRKTTEYWGENNQESYSYFDYDNQFGDNFFQDLAPCCGERGGLERRVVFGYSFTQGEADYGHYEEQEVPNFEEIIQRVVEEFNRRSGLEKTRKDVKMITMEHSCSCT